MIYNLYLPLLVSFYMAFNPNKLVSMNSHSNKEKDDSINLLPTLFLQQQPRNDCLMIT